MKTIGQLWAIATAALPLSKAAEGPIHSPAASTSKSTITAPSDLWTAHIEPLLNEHCVKCHGPLKQKSGLDLSSFQAILKGGERGPALVPGQPEASNLYLFIQPGSDPHMPSEKSKQLSREEIMLVKTWIQKIPVLSVPAGATPSTNLAE